MENQSPLIKILNDNESKILTNGKYTKNQFDYLIRSLTQAESTRFQILEKIKETGKIDVEKIKSELGLSDEIV